MRHSKIEVVVVVIVCQRVDRLEQHIEGALAIQRRLLHGSLTTRRVQPTSNPCVSSAPPAHSAHKSPLPDINLRALSDCYAATVLSYLQSRQNRIGTPTIPKFYAERPLVDRL